MCHEFCICIFLRKKQNSEIRKVRNSLFKKKKKILAWLVMLVLYWQSDFPKSADQLFPQVKGSRSYDNNFQCDFSAIIFSHVNPHRAESEKSMPPAEKHELSSVWGDYILLVRGEGAEGRKSQVRMTMCNAPWLIDCSTLNGRSWMDTKTGNVEEQAWRWGRVAAVGPGGWSGWRSLSSHPTVKHFLSTKSFFFPGGINLLFPSTLPIQVV